MEDVCLVKIGRSDHKFEWLIGSVYMNVVVVVCHDQVRLQVSQGFRCRDS